MSREEFLDMVAIAESTPGPVAVNSATYIGYKIGGTAGAAASTAAVSLPSFVVIYIISLFFDRFLSLTVVANAFKGIQACVVYLILSAGLKMLKQLKRTPSTSAFWRRSSRRWWAARWRRCLFSSIYYILLSGAAGVLVWLVKKAGGGEMIYVQLFFELPDDRCPQFWRRLWDDLAGAGSRVEPWVADRERIFELHRGVGVHPRPAGRQYGDLHRLVAGRAGRGVFLPRWALCCPRSSSSCSSRRCSGT